MSPGTGECVVEMLFIVPTIIASPIAEKRAHFHKLKVVTNVKNTFAVAIEHTSITARPILACDYFILYIERNHFDYVLISQTTFIRAANFLLL